MALLEPEKTIRACPGRAGSSLSTGQSSRVDSNWDRVLFILVGPASVLSLTTVAEICFLSSPNTNHIFTNPQPRFLLVASRFREHRWPAPQCPHTSVQLLGVLRFAESLTSFLDPTTFWDLCYLGVEDGTKSPRPEEGRTGQDPRRLVHQAMTTALWRTPPFGLPSSVRSGDGSLHFSITICACSELGYCLQQAESSS